VLSFEGTYVPSFEGRGVPSFDGLGLPRYPQKTVPMYPLLRVPRLKWSLLRVPTKEAYVPSYVPSQKPYVYSQNSCMGDGRCRRKR